MKFTLRLLFLICVVCSLFLAQTAHAVTLGWGDIIPSNNDSDFDMILIANGTSAQTLGAGTYQATNFNYQFTEMQTTIGGTVTPLVLTSPAANVYTVIGIGTPVTYSSAGSFTTTTFGGTDTFTLNSATTVYGGFYWDGSAGLRNPIGFSFSGSGVSTYVRYAGANAPVLNSNTSGGFDFQSASRRYDFSVDIQPAVVPEPSTLLAAGVAVVGLLYVARNRRKSV
jgi:hypothetical protein